MSEYASKTLYFQEGTADKMYQVVIQWSAFARYDVHAKWGRRGGTLQSQTKLTRVSIQAAMAKMEDLLASKRKKGYKDDPNALTDTKGKVPKLLPLKKVSTIGAFPHKLEPPKVYEDSFVAVGNTARRIKE